MERSLWERQSFCEKSKWLLKREKRPLEKRFCFTCTTGICCFTCKKGCWVFMVFNGNIDFVIDFVIDFWPQKQGFKYWICKSIIQLFYIEIWWKSIATFCNWLESISDAQGTVMILSWLILVTYETLFTMRGTTGGILQHHQILRLPRKMTLQHFKEISRKQLKRHFQCGADPRMIREWSEQHPSRKPSAATRLATEVTFQDHHEHFVLKNTTFRAPAIIPNFTEYCACHEKWHFNFTEYCACHAKWLSWYCHDWSSSHMKRYLQCAEQQVASSNITKYCACHAKWLSWLVLVTYETLFTMRGTTGGILQHHQILRLPRKMILQNFREISRKQLKRHFQCGADPSWIRAGSELDPTMIREWNRHPQPASQPRLLFRTTTSILYWKIQHFALRLSFQISPNTAPATKSDTSTSPNTAPATKSDTWTSPNNAPATKSDTWTSQNSDTNLISYESLLKRI